MGAGQGPGIRRGPPVVGQDKRGWALHLVLRQGHRRSGPVESGLIIAGGFGVRSGPGAQKAGCCSLVTALLPDPLWMCQGADTAARQGAGRSPDHLKDGAAACQVHPIEWPGFPQGATCPQIVPVRPGMSPGSGSLVSPAAGADGADATRGAGTGTERSRP